MSLAGALSFAGDYDEVIALVETAMRLNPLYPFFYPHYIGIANFGLGRYGAAIEPLESAIALNTDVLWPHVFLAACLGHVGEAGRAHEQVAEVRRIHPDLSADWLRTYLPYKRHGDLDALLDGLEKAGLPA